jgi:DNA-binding PadR family transcriptional regulator
MCVILAGEEPLTGQALKTRLERHYDERIEPRSFQGALSALEDAGFVERREAGIADEYELTDAGERRVREHYTWMGERMAQRTGEQVSERPEGGE